MNLEQTKAKLINISMEAVSILKEYEPNSGYLNLVYMTEDNGEASLRIWNDAFKKDDVKPVDVWVDNPEIKPREVKTVSMDELPQLRTDEEYFAMYDECVLQVSKMSGSAEFLVLAAMLKQKMREGFA